MKFLKKNWLNLVLLVFIALLIFPQTRKPIQVGLNRIFAFEPAPISKNNRDTLNNYNWELYALSGQKTNLNQARGEVVLINLWATWCPPCIAEMPDLQVLYEDYGHKMEFYFVSSEKIPVLKNFMNTNNYTFPVLRPGAMSPEALQSKILPTTFVLSKSGEIVIAKKGTAHWNDPNFRKFLDELINE